MQVKHLATLTKVAALQAKKRDKGSCEFDLLQYILVDSCGSS